jgi:hypothetical protein
MSVDARPSIGASAGSSKRSLHSTGAPTEQLGICADEVAMISMDSLDAVFLCPRCGCAAFHSNSGECIDALRRQMAELQFKKAQPQGRTRQRRSAKVPGSYVDVEIPSCSVCGLETRLYVNGVPICPDCDKAIIGTSGRSFAQVSEALTLARQEYSEALAGRRGDPDDTEAIRKANARVDAASLAYAKALRNYRAFLRKGQSRVARAAG